jgi:O-acetyl-ADP-ribose deacetylase (regulator of RNase III)
MQMRINNHRLELVKSDITESETDAIVNAANSKLIMGGGVAGAILKKGGNEIQQDCYEKAPVNVGEAAITTGGKLKAKYVIHTVGPRMGEGNEDRKLKNATLNALKLADKHNIKSIAFPAVSAGIFGFPIERCANIMLNTTIDYLQNQQTEIGKVVFCLFSDSDFKIFQNALQAKKD